MHSLCLGIGHGEGRADAALRANGAKQIGVVIALVGGLSRPRSASCPLANLAVFLSDPGLVLEPNLDRLALWDVGEMSFQRRWEVFLNAAIVSAFWPG